MWQPRDQNTEVAIKLQLRYSAHLLFAFHSLILSSSTKGLKCGFISKHSSNAIQKRSSDWSCCRTHAHYEFKDKNLLVSKAQYTHVPEKINQCIASECLLAQIMMMKSICLRINVTNRCMTILAYRYLFCSRIFQKSVLCNGIVQYFSVWLSKDTNLTLKKFGGKKQKHSFTFQICKNIFIKHYRKILFDTLFWILCKRIKILL